MNEVDNHYSGQSGSGQSGEGAKSRGSSSKPADIAKAALDQATTTAKDSLKGAKSGAKSAVSKATEGYNSATRRVSDAGRRSAGGLNQTRDSVQRFIEDNPIMVGVAGLAAGLLIGSLLPGTRRENEVFGRYADEVRDQGLRYARDLAEQGKHFVEESLDTASEGAGGESGHQTGGSAQRG